MNPETMKLMQDPEFQEKVITLKDSGKYKSWSEIRDAIKEETGKDISLNGLMSTYRRTIATNITVNKKAEKNFAKLVDPLKDRFEKMIKRTEVLSQAFDQLIKELDANPELSVSEKAKYKLKLVDDLEKLNKIFTRQLEIVLDEIDKIKIEQSRMIYDDAKIIKKINDSIPEILKELDEKGKIAIIDASILDK